MRTPYSSGKTAGDMISYIYQMLFELTIESMTPDCDPDAMDERCSALITLIETCGLNGLHESNQRVFLTEGMVLEATTTLRLRREHPGESDNL